MSESDPQLCPGGAAALSTGRPVIWLETRPPYKKLKIDGILLLNRARKTAVFRWTSMVLMRLPGNGFVLLFLMFSVILARRSVCALYGLGW